MNDLTIPDLATSQTWAVSQQPKLDRLDAWENQLCNSHLSWAIQEKPDIQFDARMQYRYFNDFRIINCSCDRFQGFRSISEISETDQDYLNLLYIRKGVEHLTMDGKDLLLKSGDMVIWSSQSKMTFNVLEPLDKISILMPEKVVTSIFPRAIDYLGLVIPDTIGVGATLGNHVNTLSNQLNELTDEALSAMMRPTMEMVAAAFSDYCELTPSTMKHIALNRVKQFIINNLTSENLTPTHIAQVHQITPRYLHMLFETEGISVGNWIKVRRIERCKEDLVRSLVTQDSITEIAFRWGFSDISHFSRCFKQQTGRSPRAFQNESKAAFLKRPTPWLGRASGR